MNRIHPAAMAALLALCAGWPGPAAAYVGPGAGISMLGAAIGLLVAVFMALAVILTWPLRRLLRRRSGRGPGSARQAAGPAE
jgi:membrane protein implicated in regulation of membrane protease activity